jgi:alanine racemase
MQFHELPHITGGTWLQRGADGPVEQLLTDSRKAIIRPGTVFFAIRGSRHNGHDYLPDLYKRGVRQFVVEVSVNTQNYPEAGILQVDSAIAALQRIAAHHRKQFDIPVVGITGSNGKTIVKEWLAQLLMPDRAVVKNPGSYNSQIGVPLSVWEMRPHHQIGIFEAGISQPGEMERLEQIIQPTLGIFTCIGPAHDAFFTDREQKITEKLILFKNVQLLVYCTDHENIHRAVRAAGIPVFAWGMQNPAPVQLISVNPLRVRFQNQELEITFSFTDQASIENAMHCLTLMLALNYPPAVVAERMTKLRQVPMRFEVKEGIHNTILVDDTYNNDLAGLQMSLDFLRHQHAYQKHTVILSDIEQSGLPDKDWVKAVAEKLAGAGIDRFIGIGPVLSRFRSEFAFVPSRFYDSTEEFLHQLHANDFGSEVVLIKGSRASRFERITAALQRRIHGTVLEINAHALVNNLNFFRSRLQPSTKMMVMVKAFAYGSHSVHVANLLQYHRVDYLGVAYADEGAELRQHHINIPIMVMNPSEDSFDLLLAHRLEPEIYSLGMLNKIIAFLDGRTMQIHIKLNTGMHRLGFDREDLNELKEVLRKNPNLQVVSIFSHLSASDRPDRDEQTHRQANRFLQMANDLAAVCGQRPLYHLVNTAGTLRFPEYHFDMVRLGIGLYGIDVLAQYPLQPVATLRTTVSQVRHVPAGETVGYSGMGAAPTDRMIATLAIGYADGFSRRFSNGVGMVLIHGKRVPVVGNVCMDMTMVDVTGLDVREGDTALIFGPDLPIEEVAERIDTIPYEILSQMSSRVKRVMIAESM